MNEAKKRYPWEEKKPVFYRGEDTNNIIRDIHIREIHYCLIKYMDAMDNENKNKAYCMYGCIKHIVEAIIKRITPNDGIDHDKYTELLLRKEMGDELYENYIGKYLKNN